MPEPRQPASRRQIRILVILANDEQRRQLCRELAAPEFQLTLFSASRSEEALPLLESRQADALVGDPKALGEFRRGQGRGYEEARWLPFCLLVPPGAEQEAVHSLRNGSTENVLQQTGDYYRLIPVLLRRAVRRRETSWEEVARVIRHEVNNPLTGILGNAELMLAGETAFPPKARERLSTIINLAVRLRDVVGSLEKRLRGNGNGSGQSLPADNPPPPDWVGKVWQ